jgi:hypothetical protein
MQVTLQSVVEILVLHAFIIIRIPISEPQQIVDVIESFPFKIRALPRIQNIYGCSVSVEPAARRADSVFGIRSLVFVEAPFLRWRL